MINLHLDLDERILLSEEEATWVSRDFEYLDELLLTNKKLYCTFEKKQWLIQKAKRRNVRALSS